MSDNVKNQVPVRSLNVIRAKSQGTDYKSNLNRHPKFSFFCFFSVF